ncbi:TonB C-terminal domain-containing protein [Uliginosibacterium sediminicola]|uniref:TonB C-terminal domain-containing protein n=1 Tax=Uliginosibacterium sediminicola TaxID=2024550 RepID=A0ABU9YUY2_9RHOO
MHSTEQVPIQRREEPGKWGALVLAILVHALLAGALFYGVQWQRRAPEPVEVELVTATQPPPQEVLPPPPPPPQPVVQPRPVEKPEPPVVKPDIVLAKQKSHSSSSKHQASSSAASSAARHSSSSSTRSDNKTRPDQRPMPGIASGLSEREREMLNIDVDRTRRIGAAQASAKSQVVAEQRVEGIKSAQAQWVDIISAVVKANLSSAIPPDVTGKPKAEIYLELLPDRSIREGSVRFVKSTGNVQLDKAIERALYKSSPLPPPPNPDAFERNLRFIFSPLG